MEKKKTFEELFAGTGIEPTTDKDGGVYYNFKAKLKNEPMHNQLEKLHSDCHEASHLISIGKIDEAQEILKNMDYEMHNAINDNQNK